MGRMFIVVFELNVKSDFFKGVSDDGRRGGFVVTDGDSVSHEGNVDVCCGDT